MRKALVVIDMQNDFVSGSLGTQEAQQIVPNVVKKIEAYKFEGDHIFYTRDTHTAGYLDSQEGRNLPVVHCVAKTRGWELVDEIIDFATPTTVYNKPTFGSLALAQQLMEWQDKFDEIELVGICTDICVISNALLFKAVMPEMKITVDASCCAGVTPATHHNALVAMEMCQINIDNWEEV